MRERNPVAIAPFHSFIHSFYPLFVENSEALQDFLEQYKAKQK